MAPLLACSIIALTVVSGDPQLLVLINHLEKVAHDIAIENMDAARQGAVVQKNAIAVKPEKACQ